MRAALWQGGRDVTKSAPRPLPFHLPHTWLSCGPLPLPVTHPPNLMVVGRLCSGQKSEAREVEELSS